MSNIPKSWTGVRPGSSYAQPPTQSLRGTRGVNRIMLGLDVANDEREYAQSGRSIYVLGDSSAVAEISLDEPGNRFPISRGFGLAGVSFEKIFLSWPAQVGRRLILLVSHEEIRVNSPDRGVSSIVDDAFALVVLAPAIVVPAGPAEWTLLKADEGNSASIYLGGPTISAVRGMPLAPGDSLVIPGQPEVWGMTTIINQVLWKLRMEEPA